MENYLHQEGYNFMGAAFEVYNELNNGFLEEVYQQCLERELELRSIPFKSKYELTIVYKGKAIEKTYIPDLIVYNEMVVELKAVQELNDNHEAQLLNYLKITGSKVGYLVNFGHKNKLEWTRMMN